MGDTDDTEEDDDIKMTSKEGDNTTVNNDTDSVVNDESDDDKEIQQDITHEDTANECDGIKQTVSDITRDFVNMSFTTCTAQCCSIADDKYMLKCSTCKELTHYSCTKLPAYQLCLFLRKSYRIYICEKCVGEIPNEIIENSTQAQENKIPSQAICTQTTTTFKTYEQLTEKNEKINNELALKEEELDRVYDEKNKHRNENLRLKQSVANLEEHQETLRRQVKTKDELLVTLKKKEKISVDLTTENQSAIQSNYTLIDDKLQQFSTNILETVTKIVDDKMNDLANQFKSLERLPEKITENCKTFKDTLTENIHSTSTAKDLRDCMKETRNEQLVQERERKLRASNIIIHGVDEKEGNSKENDEEFINVFLGTIGNNTKPESIVRLGKYDMNKSRPIKVKMISENEKLNVMSRLSNLKNAEENLKRISVTDDYTIEERAEIRKWIEKAKEHNRDEQGNITWKVRGTPKNGLRLVRFTKRENPMK